MPQLSIRPNVVVLLTDLDATHRTPGSLFRRDGSLFTTAEYDLISSSTPAEIAAANAQRRLKDDWMSDLYSMQKSLYDLFTKYVNRLPVGILCSSDDVYDSMTDEDYAEFERLVEAIKARDPFKYRAEGKKG